MSIQLLYKSLPYGYSSQVILLPASEVVSSVTRSFLTRTAQEALHAFSCPKKVLRNAYGNMI